MVSQQHLLQTFSLFLQVQASCQLLEYPYIYGVFQPD